MCLLSLTFGIDFLPSFCLSLFECSHIIQLFYLSKWSLKICLNNFTCRCYLKCTSNALVKKNVMLLRSIIKTLYCYAFDVNIVSLDKLIQPRHSPKQYWGRKKSLVHTSVVQFIIKNNKDFCHYWQSPYVSPFSPLSQPTLENYFLLFGLMQLET